MKGYTEEEELRGLAFASRKHATRDYRVHPDLMPCMVEVKKSTVELLVDGKPWNPEIEHSNRHHPGASRSDMVLPVESGRSGNMERGLL